MGEQPFYAQWSFEVTDYSSWRSSLTDVLEVLQASAGFVSLHLLHSPDEVQHYSVISQWQNVGSYRRAVSSTSAKLVIWPFLSTMIDQPSTFETLLAVSDGESTEYLSSVHEG